MKTFVSRDKMSRKNRRSLDLTRRRIWDMNPITRVRPSGKLYDRRRAKLTTEE